MTKVEMISYECDFCGDSVDHDCQSQNICDKYFGWDYEDEELVPTHDPSGDIDMHICIDCIRKMVSSASRLGIL